MSKYNFWEIKSVDTEKAVALSDDLNISLFLSTLLLNRNDNNLKMAKSFLRNDINNLENPLKLSNMQEAIDKIFEHIKKKNKILIYGDYDADGITSTVLLKEVFKILDYEVSYYIPNRINEGYGLNKEAIEKISNDGISLVITVDCGVSSFKEVDYGKSLGLDFLITDHHQIPDKLPDTTIINPLLDKDSPWEFLAGVGVAFKLGQALYEKKYQKSSLESLECLNLLDLVCVGTISDLVPLRKENRILAKFGLEVLQSKSRVGFTELAKKANLNIDRITSTDISFGIAPRINATGRISNSNIAVDLLFTKDKSEAALVAGQIEDINLKRKDIEKNIFLEAEERIREEKLYLDDVLVVANSKWHTGVLGIVAAKLVETYKKPVFLFDLKDKICTGSARSIMSFNLFESINKLKDILIRFGGHSQAAGLSLKMENLNLFRKKINDIYKEVSEDSIELDKLMLDCKFNLDYLNENLYKDILKLEPFGESNPSPLFYSNDLLIKNIYTVGQGEHLKVKLGTQKNTIIDSIGFSMGGFSDQISDKNSFAFEIDKNFWNGKESFQLMLRDISTKNIIQNQDIIKPIFTSKGEENLELIDIDFFLEYLNKQNQEVILFSKNEEKAYLIEKIDNKDNIKYLDISKITDEYASQIKSKIFVFYEINPINDTIVFNRFLQEDAKKIFIKKMDILNAYKDKNRMIYIENILDRDVFCQNLFASEKQKVVFSFDNACLCDFKKYLEEVFYFFSNKVSKKVNDLNSNRKIIFIDNLNSLASLKQPFDFFILNSLVSEDVLINLDNFIKTKKAPIFDFKMVFEDDFLRSSSTLNREKLAQIYVFIKYLAEISNPITISKNDLLKEAHKKKLYFLDQKILEIALEIFKELGFIDYREDSLGAIYFNTNPKKISLSESMLHKKNEKNKEQRQHILELIKK